MQKSLLSKTPTIIAAWEQQRSLIEHIVQFSTSVVVITAPTGAGKSTFAQYCATAQGGRLRKITISAKQFQQEGIFHCLANALGLAKTGVPVDETLLRKTLDAQMTACGQTWVLFIDDANLVPVEGLKAIMEFAHTSQPQKQLHLVLLGSDMLERRLRSNDFSEFTASELHFMELEPWSMKDIKLLITNQAKNQSVSDESLSKLYSLSKGMPGKCIEALECYLEKQESKPQPPRAAAMKTEPKDPSTPKTIALPKSNTDVTKPKANARELIKESLQMPSKSKKQLLTNPVFLGIFMGLFIASAYLLPHLGEEDDWVDTPNASMFVTNVAQENWQSDGEKLVAKVEYSTPEEVSPAEEENGGSVVAKQAPPLVNQVPTLAKRGSESIDQYGYTSDEQALLLSNSRHFTLELHQETDASRALGFISRHGLDDKASLFRTQTQGKNRFVVVYGQYPSASMALSALDKMPDTLNQDKVQPTVRELRGVQEEIRSRKEG